MKEYEKPTSLGDMIQLLSKVTDTTFYLAGGTDLIVGLRKARIDSYRLIDLSELDEMRGIYETDEYIYMGSLTTMDELCRSLTIRTHCPALAMAASEMGSVQVRNRATIGGNIINAAQCSDTLPCLYAYDAKINVLTKSGAIYEKPIRELVVGICRTSLKKDELVTQIKIKKRDSVSGFSKIGARKKVTISKLNGCILMDFEKDEVVVYLGAVGVKPSRATLLESVLKKEWFHFCNDIKPLFRLTDRIKNVAYQQIDTLIPTRSSRYYKRVAIWGLLDSIGTQLENIYHEREL